MWRNTLSFVLAAIAAAAALVSVFFDWYGARDGRHFKWTELFTADGVSAENASLFEGLFLPMLIAAALAVAGILLRSRLLMLLGGITALGITILWMVRQYQVTDSLTIGANGLKWPVAAALGSGLLMLFGAAGMAGRHVREHRVPAAEPQPRAYQRYGRGPEAAQPYPDETGRVHQGPWPRDTEAPEPQPGEPEHETGRRGRRRHAA
ncbi:hypothetical protein [Streptomyces sp. NBC_01803]|uniref:hypothetical protein n=1 Tax=Streptomyces sp. NBC_01803 TaxID=2975946 RepID=UPI002DDBC599|nr:hypothetical protein [Streptomyces sp. NBC_01803]WSA44730.1 hypothetical protein OIE51_11260 [Streptomyces sp. NBC_01803]